MHFPKEHNLLFRIANCISPNLCHQNTTNTLGRPVCNWQNLAFPDENKNKIWRLNFECHHCILKHLASLVVRLPSMYTQLATVTFTISNNAQSEPQTQSDSVSTNQTQNEGLMFYAILESKPCPSYLHINLLLHILACI